MKQEKYQQIKKRLLLIITVVFLLLIFIVNFFEYNKTKREFEEKIEIKSIFVQQVYDNILSSYKTNLTQRAYEVITRDDIKEAFKKRDRKRLQALTYPIFIQMQEMMEGFSIMHFHMPNGDSFLRLHALGNYDDSLWDIRAMIRQVHLKKKPTFGFEMGKFDDSFLTYRVAIPIFDKSKNYLGAFEIGVNSIAIVNQIKEIFHKIDAQAAFFVQKDKLRYSLTLPHVQKERASLILASKTPHFLESNLNFSKDLNTDRFSNDSKVYQIKTYESLIKNFLNESIGLFVLQYNITSDAAMYKRNLIFLVVLSIVIMILIVLIVNYGFNYYLNQIQKEHKKFEKEHEKAQLILNAQNNLVLLVDNKKPVLANKAFLQFFNIGAIEEFQQKYGSIEKLFIAKKRHFSIDREEDWVKKLKDTPLQYRKVAMRHKDEEVIFEIDVSEYEGNDNIYVLTFDDITQLINTQDKLAQKAYKDSLTGIYNRRYFQKLTSRLFEEVRHERAYSIMLFDIDKFKDVNDTYGHNFGDEVLKVISKRVSQNLRSEDTFVRWGGEEFIVLLKNTDLEAATNVAQKLREAIKTDKINQIRITCSFGVTQVKQNDDENSLIERVDKAMYQAKKEGRDRVVGGSVRNSVSI